MNNSTLEITACNITNEVPTAVWISTLIKTYENIEILNNGDYWIPQTDIQSIARLLCHKNIDNARISQWCNADHPNNTYNYLRAKNRLRRLTKTGEFSNHKEIPKQLPINEIISSVHNLKLSDLLDWYHNKYKNLNFDNESAPDFDLYLKTSTNNTPAAPLKEIQHKDANVSKPLYCETSLLDDYFCDDINKRALSSIKLAWDTFSHKVGNGLLPINKEASMQLQFAYVLQQMLPLIIFQDDESINFELETSVFDGTRKREVDIMINILKGDDLYRIAIELKCYKTFASSGGKRGANDIFMKDVYQDLDLIEKYVSNKEADLGITFVMTDYKSFIYPSSKRGKCWDYDISQNATAGNTVITTPIGGYPVTIELKKQYTFNWSEVGDYFFVMLLGK